ncbi:phosphatidate cytidylyltransferase [Thermomonas flagellata]|uniref:phosphatidate cytidylyltransferase n=1 Tax=Thermomonas flagellata TaxID=2888524 RepID=UPI001F0408C1|nr:phosphatidate cytidylyltransferase [Thermomonas flagellata]
MTRTRLLAALVMAPAVILAVLLAPTPLLAALAAAVFLIALWEWLRLAEISDTLARTALLACNVALMAALAWGSRTRDGGSLALLQLAVVIGVGWWLLALLWLRHPGFAAAHDGPARMAKLAAGSLAVIPAWCALALIHATPPNGHRWLLLALCLVWAADTGAYFAGRRFGGRWFGGRRLAPRISPNKTLEGLAGGLLLVLLVALAGAPLAGASATQLPAVALVALATALAAVLGDLFESLLKRQAGVKDAGDLIPGHGGLLDRLDSVLAALPVFALGKAWLGF